jgi:peptidoglycan/LPS O-acetylase OafA/YrhL
VKPTRISVLFVIALVAAGAAYALTSQFYDDLPQLPLYGPVFLIVLALAEGYTASTTAARLAGRPRTQPIHPLTVARIAALAKATSPVAALAAGGYAGFLVEVAGIEGMHARADLRVAIVGIVAGAALAVAALAMEHVCRVKQPPEDDDYRAPHE